jgi:hypothetical protein
MIGQGAGEWASGAGVCDGAEGERAASVMPASCRHARPRALRGQGEAGIQSTDEQFAPVGVLDSRRQARLRRFAASKACAGMTVVVGKWRRG